jgi:hypothetical protein
MTSPFRAVVTRDEMADPTLAGVFEHLSQFKYELAEVTLVVHGNAEGELIVPLNSADTDDRTSPAELSKALDAKVLNPLSDGQITEKTRIRLQACFSGHGAGGHKMVNVLDAAFGGGEGTVIAPTVEVAYAKDIWHSEGLSGWWVKSETPLTTDELAAALKLKYAKAVGELDLSTYQEDTGDHHIGERMQSEDEKWKEIARTATEDSGTGSDGVMRWVYVSAAFMQGVKPGYEDDPVLYTKSAYGYRPKEL